MGFLLEVAKKELLIHLLMGAARGPQVRQHDSYRAVTSRSSNN